MKIHNHTNGNINNQSGNNNIEISENQNCLVTFAISIKASIENAMKYK